jgi:ABC-type branched-subunit amino acid transport system ATPase component
LADLERVFALFPRLQARIDQSSGSRAGGVDSVKAAYLGGDV